jgi:uncharacterized protein (DUF736 family)
MSRVYGQLTHDPENQGYPFKGSIASPMISGRIALKPLDKRSTNAPDFAVLKSSGPSTAPVEVGNAWVKKHKDGPKAGKDFLTITFDGPDFDKPFYVTAFRRDDNDAELDITWNRPQGGGGVQPVDNE